MKDKPAPQGVSSARRTGGVRIPHLPLEWMDSGTWRLPSGKAVAEFALQSGFLAPQLLQPERRRESRTAKAGAR